ncbi:MAG: flgD [Phenylobacterium sp.]|jgi:flagellar basal-body rod modification protein FlgD|uniref:flagellar hook assembly protein FlgD n=1 Tax=Phenylobacterium sp. TaxID=1871053 RepID=UPI002617E240|nr:flagellar hook capping FlgD N-terminal domain-containing protein [Phenylobacterium sp.]MDB5435354.1 flgD [Phenylobacterium sp.]MDB5497336.1 flgD [Phenylobacterium sp.]
MTVTATTPTTPAQPAASSTNTTALGAASLADNFNTFLTLLTTQLKNQDPTAPLDSNQFTQQLVQMTGVEQQINANDLLTQLVANTGNGISTAVTLIGKNVKAVSDTANLSNGQAQWTYNLSAAASDLKVEVLDANGKVVHAEAPSDMKAGDHAFSWNGKDLTNTQLPNGGTYSLRVTALDSAGNAITETNYVQGVVTGVTQSNGSTSITVNGGPVDWSKVTSVEQVASTTPTPTPATA